MGLGVEETHCPAVWHPPGLASRCRFMGRGRKYRQPYDVGFEVWIRDPFHDALFNFGGPPKTDSSRWVKQEHQPNLAYILVERVSQWIEGAVELCKGNVRALAK